MKKTGDRLKTSSLIQTTSEKINTQSDEFRNTRVEKNSSVKIKHGSKIVITQTHSSPLPKEKVMENVSERISSEIVTRKSSLRETIEAFNNLSGDKKASNSASKKSFNKYSTLERNFHLHNINEGKEMNSLDSTRTEVRKVKSLLLSDSERPTTSSRQLSRTSSLRINSSSDNSVHHLIRFFNTPLYQHFYFQGGDEFISSNDLERSKKLITVTSDSIKKEDHPKNDDATRKSLLTFENTQPHLWSCMPQVMSSGILEKISPQQLKLQYTMFELLTSEASYYSSLAVLEMHFACSLHFYKDTAVISRVEHKYLFGNVPPVRKVSEKMVLTLNKCFEKDILMEDLPFLILKEVNDEFKSAYIHYCRNIPLVLETHEKLCKEEKYCKAVATLEASKNSQNLKLNSFLILPVQRILRMTLLIDGILTKMPTIHRNYKIWQDLHLLFKQMSEDCNTASGEVEDIHKKLTAMNEIISTLYFPSTIRPLSLLSATRSLVLSDTFTRHNNAIKLTTHKHLIYLYLFSDYLLLTKHSSGHRREVLDYCHIDESFMEPIHHKNHKNCVKLILQKNHGMKTKEMVLEAVDSGTMEKWLKALKKSSFDEMSRQSPGKKLIEENHQTEVKSPKHHNHFLSLFHRHQDP